MIPAILTIEDERFLSDIENACEKLEIADGELLLDLSSVRRLDPSGVNALKKLTSLAGERSVKLVVRGVSVDVYRVLKLVRLADQLSFTA